MKAATWAPSTDEFAEHETLEDANAYADGYSGEYGPIYVLTIERIIPWAAKPICKHCGLRMDYNREDGCGFHEWSGSQSCADGKTTAEAKETQP